MQLYRMRAVAAGSILGCTAMTVVGIIIRLIYASSGGPDHPA